MSKIKRYRKHETFLETFTLYFCVEHNAIKLKVYKSILVTKYYYSVLLYNNPKSFLLHLYPMLLNLHNFTMKSWYGLKHTAVKLILQKSHFYVILQVFSVLKDRHKVRESMKQYE